MAASVTAAVAGIVIACAGCSSVGPGPTGASATAGPSSVAVVAASGGSSAGLPAASGAIEPGATASAGRSAIPTPGGTGAGLVPPHTAAPRTAAPHTAAPHTAAPHTAPTPSGLAPAGGDAASWLPGEPDPELTPGATNPTVTQATIRTTICVSGWTATVRPPTSYTTPLKREQIGEYGYTDTSLADYEEDHLIPLELGGSPSDAANLWPEPYAATLPDGTNVGARVKDQLENRLHALVCDGAMSLVRAQQLIRVDWIAAWRTYVLGTGPTPTMSGTPVPAPTVATPGGTSTPAPTGASRGTAVSVTITSLSSPVSRGGTASLTARTAPAAACTITVVYKSGPSGAAGLVPKTAGTSGSVSWSWRVGPSTTPGTWPVTVACTRDGATGQATRSFVVR